MRSRDRRDRSILRLPPVSILTALVLLTASMSGAAPGVGGSASVDIALRADGRGHPWINLRDGRPLPTTYAGDARHTTALATGKAHPLALAAGDFDGDGVADLLVGHAGLRGGGLLSLHRGNVDAIYPNSPGARQRLARGQLTDAPFHPEARLFAVPEPPEFLATGDFDADGHLDVVLASVGSRSIYLVPGDGKGSLGSARAIPLPGTVTALAAGDVNRADGLTDVVVAVVGAVGPEVLVFEGPDGALSRAPEVFTAPATVTALALGRLDRDPWPDLAVAAGPDLLIVHGRDRRLAHDPTSQAQVPPATIHRMSFTAGIAALAVGDFAGDFGPELAVLGVDGALYLVRATAPSRAAAADPDGRSVWQSEFRTAGAWAGATRLVRTKISSLPKDDLLVVERQARQLHVLPGADGAPGRPVTLDAAGAPVAVLPMRLNRDALSDLVVVHEGRSGPAVALTAPVNVFIVHHAGDSGPGSLRQAILDANASPGADAIDFNMPFTSTTIVLLVTLPRVTEALTIDGTTHPTGMVTLDGNGPATGDGLTLGGGSNVVVGLRIIRFFDDGIHVASANNIVEGNRIGFLDTTDLRNGGNGIRIGNAPDNTVGGTAAPARNVIGFANEAGVSVSGRSATGNRIQGNFIGTDDLGTVALFTGFGVLLNGAPGNTIGGTTTGARNVIARGSNGVHIGLPRATGNLVQGNLIGTTASGTGALGNGFGVFISDAPANTIGGTVVSARNVISGNGVGVAIRPGSTGNLIRGNFIGTDVTGTRALGGLLGVTIFLAATNAVGGTVAGARNVISGNEDVGVLISGASATGNRIEGNFIGTNAAGTAALGNGVDGVRIIDAPNNRIGGTVAGARNIISGNAVDGVVISGASATGNRIQGNFIGTNATGTLDRGNVANGVLINSAPNTIIGGAGPARNVISGNNASGVFIVAGSGSRVQGNFIGTNAAGTGALANSSHGVSVGDGGSNNTIGGTAAGLGNTIAFNRGDGVFLISSGTGNAVLGNAIFSNTGLGIDLAPNGVTPNDPDDADAGPNNLQNFPVLTSAISNSTTTTVAGTLTSTASTTFRVEFFSSAACDGSNHGEAQTFLGFASVTTNAAGTASFSQALSPAVPVGRFITATATAAGNTSELSRCRAVTS